MVIKIIINFIGLSLLYSFVYITAQGALSTKYKELFDNRLSKASKQKSDAENNPDLNSKDKNRQIAAKLNLLKYRVTGGVWRLLMVGASVIGFLLGLFIDWLSTRLPIKYRSTVRLLLRIFILYCINKIYNELFYEMPNLSGSVLYTLIFLVVSYFLVLATIYGLLKDTLQEFSFAQKIEAKLNELRDRLLYRYDGRSKMDLLLRVIPNFISTTAEYVGSLRYWKPFTNRTELIPYLSVMLIFSIPYTLLTSSNALLQVLSTIIEEVGLFESLVTYILSITLLLTSNYLAIKLPMYLIKKVKPELYIQIELQAESVSNFCLQKSENIETVYTEKYRNVNTDFQKTRKTTTTTDADIFRQVFGSDNPDGSADFRKDALQVIKFYHNNGIDFKNISFFHSTVVHARIIMQAAVKAITDDSLTTDKLKELESYETFNIENLVKTFACIEPIPNTVNIKYKPTISFHAEDFWTETFSEYL